jgi:hypothetical protein
MDDIRESFGCRDSASDLAFNQRPDDYFMLVVRTAPANALCRIAALVRQIDPGIVTMRGAAMTARVNDSQSAYCIGRWRGWWAASRGWRCAGVVGLFGVISTRSINGVRRSASGYAGRAARVHCTV